MNNIFFGQPHRNPAYLDWVKSLPSAISGTPQCGDAHHLIGNNRQGMKVSDYLTLPLTRQEHDELHNKGFKRWESMWGPQSHYVNLTILRAIDEGILKP